MSVRQIQMSRSCFGVPRTAISWQMMSLGLILGFHGPPPHYREAGTQNEVSRMRKYITEMTISSFHGNYVKSCQALILKYNIHTYVT